MARFIAPLALLHWLCFGLSVVAQQPNFVHFGVDDGLPSAEVYQVLQDRQGMLWIATDKGISRFDGQEFVNYSVQNGLPDNVVFWMQADARNRLWFTCHNGAMGYIHEEKVRVLTRFEHNAVDGADFVVVGDTAYIGVSDELPYVLKVRADGTTDIQEIYQAKGNGFCAVEVAPGKWVRCATRPIYEQERVGRWYNEQPWGQLGSHLGLDWIQRKDIPGGRMWKDGESTFLTFGDDLLWMWQGRFRSIHLQHQRTNFLQTTGDSLLWLCTHDRGVARLDLREPQHPEYWLENYSVSHLYVDHEGGMWFSTLEDGLYYLPQPRQRSYPVGRINFVRKRDRNYLVGYRNNQLGQIDSGRLTYKMEVQGRFRDLIYTPLGWHLTGTGLKPFVSLPDGTVMRSHSLGYNTMEVDRDQQLWSAGTAGLFLVSEGANAVIDTLQIRSFSIDGNNNKWLGTTKGLFRYGTDGSLRQMGLLPVRQQVSAIAVGERMVLAAGKGHGIALLDVNGKSLGKMARTDGLLSDFVNVLRLTGDTLWVGTNRGLCIVTQFADEKHRRFFHFTHRDGLLSDEVTDVLVEPGLVSIGTSKGLNVVSRETFFDEHVPLMLHLHTLIDGDPQPDPKLAFQSNQTLEVQLSGVAFRHGDQLHYAYRLFPRDDNWITTTDHRVVLQNLPPGRYRLDVKALTPGASSRVIRRLLVVEPTFWQSGWFFALLALLVFGGTALLFRLRELRYRARVANENQQLQLRYQALSAQMNPHFVFNSLGSIQRLVMDRLTNEAITYLAGFGRLMRQILHHSDRLFVPLDQEMELVEEYVRLERLRFDADFDFSWDIASQIDTAQTALPTMLLQPLVENAIHHGILPLKKEGAIVIRIRQADPSTLELEIEDNGKGLTPSVPSEGQVHESKGISLLEERLSVFRRLFGSRARIELINRADIDPGSRGTTVRLLVPFQAEKP